MQRRDEYQGFKKYGEELNRYRRQEAKTAINGMSTGLNMEVEAGLAALAALKMHYQQKKDDGGLLKTVQNANGLPNTYGAYGRSNSMRTYKYNPRASYVTGLAAGAHGQAHRSNSLGSGRPGMAGGRSSSLMRNSRLNSLSSQTMQLGGAAYATMDDGQEDEEGVTVTTKTTKVMDSQGRTQSLTIETIKTLPDGSMITSTTTKNVSRNNSRSNSMNSFSMMNRGSSRSNSMGLNSLTGNVPTLNGYNLSKIEEDLHDFDYNYELDHGRVDQRIPEKDELAEYQSKSIATALSDESQLGEELSDAPLILSSLKPESTAIKPILKKTNNVSNDNSEGRFFDASGDANFVDASEALEAGADDVGEEKHPYADFKRATGPNQNEFKVPSSPPIKQTGRKGVATSNLKMSPPASVQSKVDQHSVASPHSRTSSIKFSQRIETIPAYHTFATYATPNHPEKEEKEEREELSPEELYQRALEVARNKVYGSSDDGHVDPPKTAPTSPIDKASKRRRSHSVQKPAVDSNYVYENHHKAFLIHSLRDDIPKEKSHKQRLKDEKLQQKHEKAMAKKYQKESKNKESAYHPEDDLGSLTSNANSNKNEEKKSKKLRFSSIFTRKRKSHSHTDSNDIDDFVAEQPNAVESNLKPINTDTGNNVNSGDRTDGPLRNTDGKNNENVFLSNPTKRLSAHEKELNNPTFSSDDDRVVAKQDQIEVPNNLKDNGIQESSVGNAAKDRERNSRSENSHYVRNMETTAVPTVAAETGHVDPSNTNNEHDSNSLHNPQRQISQGHEDWLNNRLSTGSENENFHSNEFQQSKGNTNDIDQDDNSSRYSSNVAGANSRIAKEDFGHSDNFNNQSNNVPKMENASLTNNDVSPDDFKNARTNETNTDNRDSSNEAKAQSKEKASGKNKQKKGLNFRRKFYKLFVNGYRDDVQ